MPEPDAQLGVNFDANKLFYAVSRPAEPGITYRVGFVDFSFDLIKSISERDPDTFPGLCETLEKLVRDHEFPNVRIMLPPFFECWSIVPKSVFDEDEERRAHLNILMQGTSLDNTQTRWHQLSNRDFKLVSVRRKEHLDSFTSMLNGFPSDNLFSDFEVGNAWMQHSGFRGSFMTISSYNGMLSVSSFLLGKLRAATYFTYDDISDIPYLWLQYASHLPWMTGLHENVMVFGDHSSKIVETLKAYWDDSSEILVMNSLHKMNLESEEESFSFPLERAFPAILLSVS